MEFNEKEHVVDVYNAIATMFSSTRTKYRIWGFVKRFIETIDKRERILDAGCGNGKNMIQGYNFEGFDISENLVKIARDTGYNIKLGSVTEIPYENNIFDRVICIAVIHHLNSRERRIKCLEEISRVLKLGGTALVSGWQYSDSDPKRDNIDGFVDWKDPKNDKVYKRYYHMFVEGELDELVSNVNSLQIIDTGYEQQNYFVIVKKVDG